MLPFHRLVLSLGGVLLAAQAAPAVAQSATQMIEQLLPRNDTPGVLRPRNDTRGIRVPSADSGASAAFQTAPSARPEDSPATARPAPPSQDPSTTIPAAAAQTTAPAGTPALSITVQFLTASASLTPAAERALVPLGQALSSAELAPYRFRIEGHTDTVGPEEMNRELSQRRAEAVRDFLMRHYNVPASRLEAVGLGESELLVHTGDNRAEQLNRRVQVLNIGS